MKLKEMEAGTKLELEVLSAVGENVEHILISEFEWADDENVALIATPIYEGVLFPLHIGVRMNVYFVFKGDFYKFSSKVLGRRAGDNISLLKVEIQGEFERIQRRQFFRFEYSVPFKFRVEASSANPKADKPDPFKSTITRDIGGGGLCFLLEDTIEIGVFVDGELELGDSEKTKFIGKVVRVSKREVETRYKYDIGIEFDQIENKVREAIIRYIFQEQRKLRKKGLI
jgi:c-di-GMP-binding flagellar brake protein YcgR